MDDLSPPKGKPANALWFVILGGVLGYLSGYALGQLTWSVAFNDDAFLNWLHPQISGSTSFFLGIFFFDVLFLPIILAGLGGILLPLGYVFAKWNDNRSMSLIRWLAFILGATILIVVTGFWGPPQMFVLTLIQLVPSFTAAAGLTVVMITLFNTELKKLPLPVDAKASDAA